MTNPNQELIEYVDVNGVPTGETEHKLDAHDGNTKLHAAFSCYVFDGKGQLLVTKRAAVKKVWPNVWTNSVCGHLLPGESREQAIARRAEFELGAKLTDLQVVLPTYAYITPPYNGIIENEFCPVYLARIDGVVDPNSDEVSEHKWLDWTDFVEQSEKDTSNVWSFWCKDQVRRFNDKLLKVYIGRS